MADYSEREKELKAFDDTKLGVKGLVDAGITKIPRIFYHPHDNFKCASDLGYKDYTIPVIDLGSIIDEEDPSERKRVVERVKEASEKWGFFQIVNHGIPVSTLQEMIDGVLRFFEQDNEVKKEFYTREQRPFMYTSNISLYATAASSWKDSFICNLAPNAPKPEDLPAVCRISYGNMHSDVDFITLLLQDQIGGLQVLHQDMWIDLPPLPGALVVNIGDYLQEEENYSMADYPERLNDLKAFDDTKLGVKGLVDAGITKIPRIFYYHYPPDSYKKASDLGYKDFSIPVIDIGSISDDSERKMVVERIKEASEKWGFFQIVNHGIPVSTLEEMRNGALRFYDQDNEVKKEFYTRDLRPFFYNSNYNLYTVAPITWKDSFYCNLASNLPKPEDLPAVCREILAEYSKEVMKLGTLLFELLSEALGLHPSYLANIGCTEGLFAFSHYYPACPEPELTMGTGKHADMDFITVLLQDQIGGLQVLHQDMWIDLHPQPGALVVNIGDFLQLISNDKFKSAQHRVLANSKGPRVSTACFFSTGIHPTSRTYGPIKELLSEDNPAKYREFIIPEFLVHHRTKCLDGTPPLLHYRI